MKVCDRCRGEENVADMNIIGGDAAINMDLCKPCRVLFSKLAAAFTDTKGEVEMTKVAEVAGTVSEVLAAKPAPKKIVVVDK